MWSALFSIFGMIVVAHGASAESQGVLFSFPEQWEVQVEEGILESKVLFEGNEYLGMYTLHDANFPRSDYIEALHSPSKTEEVEQVIKKKFSDVYSDLSLLSFRKREISGLDIIEFLFKGSSKRVLAPVYIKLSSVSKGERSVEVMSMYNMDNNRSLAETEIDGILAKLKFRESYKSSVR